MPFVFSGRVDNLSSYYFSGQFLVERGLTKQTSRAVGANDWEKCFYPTNMLTKDMELILPTNQELMKVDEVIPGIFVNCYFCFLNILRYCD